MKFALFVGRWQPPHAGHDWLISQKVDEGVPPLILVRDHPDDLLPAEVVAMMLRTRWEGTGVQVMVIPDIESVNYGRNVGYQVVEHVPPDDVGGVSATEVRRQVFAGEVGWRAHVHPSIADWVADAYARVDAE